MRDLTGAATVSRMRVTFLILCLVNLTDPSEAGPPCALVQVAQS